MNGKMIFMLFSPIRDIVKQLKGKFEHLGHETGQSALWTNLFLIYKNQK